MRRPTATRRQQVEYVRKALRPSLAQLSARAAEHFEQAVWRLDSTALVAAVEVAEDFFEALRQYPAMAEECGEAEAKEMLAGAINELQEVVEAGLDCEEERRVRGIHGVRTRITRGDFGRLRVVRLRPPGRPSARPRERRAGCARRRGSRRGAGSGDRAGPDDPDADDPPGDVEAPLAGGQKAELVPTGETA
jgi:hypothetical protein